METRAWDGNFDLYLLSLEGDRQERPLLNTSFAEMNAALSPDGRFMAYQSNESGRPEIYVRPFPGVDAARWPISSEGGDQPHWSPNGKELFYFKQHQLMVVPIETAPKFSAGKAQMLLETRIPTVPMFGVLPYAMAPDGRRFLLIEEEANADPEKNASQIIVVVNWLEELRRMVAPSR
jgi:serine/threonine-protein kinase